MKVYILLDCSVDGNGGVPVSVCGTVGEALHHADLLSMDYGYDVSFDHVVVVMEMGDLYAVDEPVQLSLSEARKLEREEA